MLALIIIVFQLVNSFDFNHPEKPTMFYWSTQENCLSDCNLTVINKKNNQTVEFFPNTHYLSCYYSDNYQWQSNCDGKYCSVEIVTTPQKILFATNEKKQEKELLNGLVVIKIIPCKKLANNDCLFIDIDVLSYYGDPILKYYGPNQFDCSLNYTNNPRFEIPFKRKQIGEYYLKLKLGCRNDQYSNIDAITFEDTYYLQLDTNAKITYYIGNDLSSNTISPITIDAAKKLFQALFCLLCVIIVLLITIITYPQCSNCIKNMQDEHESEKNSEIDTFEI